MKYYAVIYTKWGDEVALTDKKGELEFFNSRAMAFDAIAQCGTDTRGYTIPVQNIEYCTCYQIGGICRICADYAE